jgi:hypothetical protein
MIWDDTLKLAITFGPPIGGGVVGFYLNKLLKDRPKLVTYLVHATQIQLRSNGQPSQTPGPQLVNTHTIVVANVGRETATRVRVTHGVFPVNYAVYPDVPHEIRDTPSGGKEILFDTVVPGEQLTISYLYFPPLVYSQVIGTVRSDESLARVLRAIPTPQAPKWVVRVIAVLAGVGVAALAIEVGKFILN